MPKLSEPVQLMDPSTPLPPTPSRGCDICAALHRQWRQATEVGGPAYDPSHATDLAVEIGRHPHRKGARR